MGGNTPALVVAPVAVLPEYQRRGIGGRMLRYGHDLGRQDDYALAFLCGHPSYYPRHGYRPCFGFGRITCDVDRLPQPTRVLERWPVRPADIPWLVERNAVEWADVDFGWLWGTALGEWRIPGVNAMIWRTEDGRRAAYTASRGADSVYLFLADDPELAREVLATFRPKEIRQHPSGWLARHVLDPMWAKAEVRPSSAAMACELQEGALQPYLDAVEAGERLVGSSNEPLPFLLWLAGSRCAVGSPYYTRPSPTSSSMPRTRGCDRCS